MRTAATALVMLLLISGGCVFFVWWAGSRLNPEKKHREFMRFLAGLALKGLFVPCCLWGLFNTGWFITPLMPQVQAGQNSLGGSVPAFLRVFGAGVFVIATYWAALAVTWLLIRAARGLDPEAKPLLKALVLTCVLALCVPAAILVLIGGWAMLGLGLLLMTGAMAGYAPGVVHVQKAPPSYARAIARVKFGKYAEAEQEIIAELEKCQDDFEGWLMLAELYATRFNDVGEAEQTILETCDNPATTPSQLSVALHRLADWHLNLANDPEAARRCLNMIATRLPGTHLARMALLKMNQLPKTRQEHLERKASTAIPMPALGDNLEQTADHEPTLEPGRAAALANDCVARLKMDPNDVGAREKLARTLMEPLGQWQMGVDQVNLLLDMPDQPEARRAEWLSWLAAWHMKYGLDSAKGRELLERLVREFPDTPQAFAARHRLRKIDGILPEPPKPPKLRLE